MKVSLVRRPGAFLHPGKDCRGGVALEYVVVSVMGAVLAVAAVTFVGKTVREKVAVLGEKLDVAIDADGPQWEG